MPFFLGKPNIEKLKAKGKVKGLIKALSYEDSIVRRFAVKALAEIGDFRALEPLITALQDKDYRVSAAAATALSQIGSPAVEPLIAALKGNDYRVRKAAAIALGQIGSPAVESLITALQDKNYHVRKAAATTLDNLGWQPDQDENGALYWIAKEKWDRCIQIGSPAVEPLITALKDGNPNAAIALGQIGAVQAVEPLITALKDGNSDVRQAAATALGHIGDVQAVEPLITALNDDNSYVCAAAATALDNLGWQPDQDENGALYWIAKEEWDRCIQIGSPAVEPLIAAMEDGNSDVREAAAIALGQIGSPAVEPLIATLEDGNPDVREAAAITLGQIGDVRAIEPLILITALKGWPLHSIRDLEAHEAAAAALVRIGSPAVEPLITVLKDDEQYVRAAAAIALGQIVDVRAAEPLITVLKDKDYRVREAAAIALGQIGDVRAVEPLIAALKENESKISRKGAAQMLVRMYRSGELSGVYKQLILAQRDTITNHRDVTNHHDYKESSDCCPHHDDPSHRDEGIGVDFPI